MGQQVLVGTLKDGRCSPGLFPKFPLKVGTLYIYLRYFLGTSLSYFRFQESQHQFSCQLKEFIMKCMDEQFLTLESYQDSIDLYWLHTDKELHQCEDNLHLLGFAKTSVTLVLFKDRLFFFITHIWKFLQEIWADRLPAVNYLGQGQ